jgi:hypothetical protein
METGKSGFRVCRYRLVKIAAELPAEGRCCHRGSISAGGFCDTATRTNVGPTRRPFQRSLRICKAAV